MLRIGVVTKVYEGQHYLGRLKLFFAPLTAFLPGVPFVPSLAFLLLLLLPSSDLRFDAGLATVLKKESILICVWPPLALANRLELLRIRSSLKFFSPHMNLTKPSSSGSLHFFRECFARIITALTV